MSTAHNVLRPLASVWRADRVHQLRPNGRKRASITACLLHAGQYPVPLQQHTLLAIMVLYTNVSVLHALSTTAATAQASAALATLHAMCCATDDGQVAVHEQTGTVCALLAHCEHLRRSAASTVAQAAGSTAASSSDGEQKALVLQAFGLVTKDSVQKLPLTTLILRLLGQVLVRSGCASCTRRPDRQCMSASV